jgi:mono/diheme cytochrome c family protein
MRCQEVGRVIARFRVLMVAGIGTLILAGCGALGESSPLAYSPNKDLVEKLKDKPKVQAQISKVVADLFGPAPDRMRVPPGAPVTQGGGLLATRLQLGEGPGAEVVYPVQEVDAGGQVELRPIRGGFALYREHCMHCHGASGDGDGPTGPWLWPRPRDFRMGVFKFTSTAGTGPDSKPTRADLRRTIGHGLDLTAMPAFDSLLTPGEIEQVIDYVIFLSARGEVESGLVYLGQAIEDADVETELSPESVQEQVVQIVFDRWRNAEDNVIEPKLARSRPTRASILRGRQFFLGEKGLQCYTCHGLDGQGDGDSFIGYAAFKHAVFDQNPRPDQFEELKQLAESANPPKKWADDWGIPLRPANLTVSRYKGGRRPLDIYWRIAKGINGTPMPGHLGTQLTDDNEVWDLVNFILALPYERTLLDGAQPVPTGLPAPETTPTATASAGG